MEAIDPMALQILTAIVVDLVAVPLFGLILNRVVTQKLDAFDRKRDEARQERNKRLEQDEKWQQAITNGMQSMLRSEIIRLHKKCMQGGYCDLVTREYAAKLIGAYHGVSGNDIGDGLYKEMIALPMQCKGDKHE